MHEGCAVAVNVSAAQQREGVGSAANTIDSTQPGLMSIDLWRFRLEGARRAVGEVDDIGAHVWREQ